MHTIRAPAAEAETATARLSKMACEKVEKAYGKDDLNE